MKAIHLFYSGLVIDALLLLLSLSNIQLMQRPMQGLAGAPPAEGLTAIGRLALWLIPLLLLALIGFAFWLKKSGKMLPANILLWIPAAPFLLGIILWGGMAALFILGGSNK